MSNNGFRYYSFNLPSFLDGLSLILDLGGTLGEYYPVTQKGDDEDLTALRSDWIVIGQDFRDVIAAYADREISERLLHE